MNVFYLDHDQSVCASYHNDRHCVKMILEYAQLLCTAHREIDGDDCRWQDILYKSTHKNHPSAVWARESVANYNWLYKMFSELCKEYTFRYEKEHASWTKLGHLLSSPPIHIPVGEARRVQNWPNITGKLQTLLQYRKETFSKLEKPSSSGMV